MGQFDASSDRKSDKRARGNGRGVREGFKEGSTTTTTAATAAIKSKTTVTVPTRQPITGGYDGLSADESPPPEDDSEPLAPEDAVEGGQPEPEPEPTTTTTTTTTPQLPAAPASPLLISSVICRFCYYFVLPCR
jgi:hypothetical protein